MSQIESIEDSNGLILKANYIPEELLIQILSFVDCAQLVLCHLVCKQWNELIKKNVWRKKAERACGQALIANGKLPWNAYHFICNEKLFNRNLLTSTDVEVFCDEEDQIKAIEVDIKSPQIGILPLPEDPLFKQNFHCVQIIKDCIVHVQRKFVIDLIKQGFNEYILDHVQPTIEVSEWYGAAPEEVKAEYSCSIKLLSNNIEDCSGRVKRVHHYHKKLNSADKQGQWFKFTHILKNYGPGLRIIKFFHGGCNNIIMAGTSVKMTMPSKMNTST